ncbi:MAG: hypothetical protein GF418_10780 [Chitinivibrionales bacterium]|nr:hypothetical protein [Chitinivibrionales bacterium]MBD3396099.1 hypothetical protein [Chitinivibrionales bacterium]
MHLSHHLATLMLLSTVLVCPAWSQDIVEEQPAEEPQGEASVPAPPQAEESTSEEIASPPSQAPSRGEYNEYGTPQFQSPSSHAPYVMDVIRMKNAQTIFGASMYFSGMALEWTVLQPWAVRFSNHLSNVDPDSISDADAQESLNLLLASLPVGMMQIGGVSVACAGASRVYGAYVEGVSPEVKDAKVWIPYIIGWIGRGASGGLSVMAGLSQSVELSLVASVFGVAGQAAWTTATVMSLVYSGKRRGEARERLSVVPIYSPDGGTGIALQGTF